MKYNKKIVKNNLTNRICDSCKYITENNHCILITNPTPISNTCNEWCEASSPDILSILYQLTGITGLDSMKEVDLIIKMLEEKYKD